MPDQVCLTGRTKNVSVTIAVLLVIAAIGVSITALRADRAIARIIGLLDDPGTEYRDFIDLSQDSMAKYQDAVVAAGTSITWNPLNADHEMTLADLLFRIGQWDSLMLEQRPGERGSTGGDASMRIKAVRHAGASVALDPADPYRRLRLANIYAWNGRTDDARREYFRAVSLYPQNSEIRYAAAVQLMLLGRAADALDQAVLLARRDDSYRLEEDEVRTTQARETNPEWYQRRLLTSYLFKALEIIWRVTRHDLAAVRMAVPDNADARAVERLFFQQKGVEDR